MCYICIKAACASELYSTVNIYLAMVHTKYKSFYNTVLSQIFSNCGGFLFIGTCFGDILVFG